MALTYNVRIIMTCWISLWVSLEGCVLWLRHFNSGIVPILLLSQWSNYFSWDLWAHSDAFENLVSQKKSVAERGTSHYEKTPIQVYWKFHKKMKVFRKKFWFFSIFLLKTDCGYSLEPPRWGGSYKYPQSTILSKNKKNNVYPCQLQFYYKIVGFKGVKIV